IHDRLVAIGTTPVTGQVSLLELLRRPEVEVEHIEQFYPELAAASNDLKQQLAVETKYEGYVKRQHSQIRQFKRLEAKAIPVEIDYLKLNGLTIQAREALAKVRPQSIGQASRVSGVSPADVTSLLIHIEQFSRDSRDNGTDNVEHDTTRNPG
ncbi:MAG: tRNA uridine-5-carboxymethylaminomethyl(34) synthesis enzyme MnmG, partial [Candidatus Aquicultor sp.]